MKEHSPALSTVKVKAVGSRLLARCYSIRCRAMELASTLPLICFSCESILLVSPLYRMSDKLQVPV